MSELSISWNIRFETSGGMYTLRTVRRKARPLSRDEVQDWAETQVRINDEYAAVDEVCPIGD